MTTLREAATQALEAMLNFPDDISDEMFESITALKAALAEPVQKPVAWIQPDHLQKARVAPFLCRVEPTQRCSDFVAIYTASPQRKPLTEEEIKECERQAMVNGSLPFEQRVFFARAIERTHGIK